MSVFETPWNSKEIPEHDNCENTCKHLQDVSSILKDDIGGEIRNCSSMENPLGGERSAPIC